MDEVREGQHSNNQSALRNTKSRQRPHYVTKSQKIQLHCPPALAKITRTQDCIFTFVELTTYCVSGLRGRLMVSSVCYGSIK